tara:strand:- start:53 stop:1636 length:1584 start_codon:yes stop_codon:yes gene_type:complete
MNYPSKERSFKEQRIREITMIYYSQPEIKKAIYEFAEARETVPRYYEGFGKRPDSLQFQNDIIEQIKRGATSFHCSEEHWSDPLEIETEMNRNQFNELRSGWDLLLDIDSPYLEYSKLYTKLLIKALEFHNVKNIGIKFSGSKGFHVIVPWKAFPKEIYNQQTKDMFPEWPRIICEYLDSIIKPKLTEKIFQEQSLKELAQRTGKEESDLVIDECISCKREATIKNQVTWICESCRDIGEVIRIGKNRIPKCPNDHCRKEMTQIDSNELLFCEYCNFNSKDNYEMFTKARQRTEKLIEADLILVAPRHLFRMPYSLHEKTALASITLDKDKIQDFQITDAKPFKFEVKEYYPIPLKDEAKELLLQALDWDEQRKKEEHIIQEMKEEASTNLPTDTKKKQQGEYKKVTIENPDPAIFPPQIKLLLDGVKQDGRKRALMILISFFKCLGVPDIEIEKRMLEWNEKNYNPIKKGYILSQLSWYKRHPDRLPPNFSNPIYKDLNVDKPDKLAMETKNPVSYAIKRYFQLRK